MRGLSVTAIAARPIKDCIEIYRLLSPVLKLEYLEIAIGTRCYVNELPKDIPLVIHNDWLFDRQFKRCRAALDSNEESWEPYYQLTKTHTVLACSWHFPDITTDNSLVKIAEQRQNLEAYLGVPFSLEVMPDIKSHGNQVQAGQGELDNFPLCLDISHLNIWAGGQQELTKQWLKRLEPSARCFHVSTNDGRSDLHQTIPEGHWLIDEIDRVDKQGFLVTYEALPDRLAQFDRRDRRK